MLDSDLERALRHWGNVYGQPPPAEWDEDSSYGSGALTGCLIDFIRVGIISGPEGEKITARGKESRGGERPMKAHPLADRIDHMVCLLHQNDRRAALALRAQYCLRSTLREKCAWVRRKSGTNCSRMNFRAAVARAKHFIGVAMNEKRAG